MVELATKFSLPPERRFRASPRCESIGDSRQGALTRRSPLPRLFTVQNSQILWCKYVTAFSILRRRRSVTACEELFYPTCRSC